jgi:hypothetical protein
MFCKQKLLINSLNAICNQVYEVQESKSFSQEASLYLRENPCSVHFGKKAAPLANSGIISL